MNIKIVCVGKIRESFLREAIAEYDKRLGRYCKLKIVEVADEALKDGASAAEEKKVLQKEAKRILSAIHDNEYVIALDIKGKKLDSQGFAKKIDALLVEGHADICFVIGGSIGLCEDVLDRANYRLSFSDMTFPHQLMRVILLEQIYRAWRIICNEPYHK